MFKLILEKAEEPNIKLPTSAGSSKKKKFLLYWLLTVWITINYGQFWKRWEYQTTWPASWEICMQVRNLYAVRTGKWNSRLVPNQERSTSRLYIVSLLIYLICRVHHEKLWAGWSTSWNQDFREKYQFSSVAQSCLTLCDPMDCSMSGLPFPHQLPEFTQTYVHWVGDAIQLSHPLSSPSQDCWEKYQ